MKKIFLFFVIFFISGFVVAEENSNQQFLDFNLAGYGQGGKKTWDVKGQSADIFESIVKLNNIVANVYGQEEMTLTAKKGSMDKVTNNMHLEQDVVATTKSGAKLTTDSLDWQRNSDLVTTSDKVTVEKENMTAVGTGAKAHPNLNQAQMNKDVTVKINTDPKKPGGGSTTITCDGPMEIDYNQQLAVFNKNVKAVNEEQGTIYADRMKVYFDFKTKQLIKIVCKGNVKIEKGENTTYSDEAIYMAAEKKVVLLGRPKLLLYTEGGKLNAPFGN